MDLNQWINEPTLEWRNTPDNQWVAIKVVVKFINIIGRFIAETRAYNFIAKERARYFIAKTRP